MPWELADESDNRYRLPASISPVQVHVGGAPEQRIVRAYGSEEWVTVLDGQREAQVFTLTGALFTDRDYDAIQTLQSELEAALGSAVALIEVDDAGDVAVLDLRGALPLVATPDGVDGTMLNVTIHLIPEDPDWRAP